MSRTQPANPENLSPADRRRELESRRDENLARIGRVVAVMSGKGGVGKSTVAAALALGLARGGLKTGLLDVDFHGPSVPTLLGLADRRPESDGETLRPIRVEPNLAVMSLGLLLGAGDDAVIWRGPMKIGVINQLLGEVAWGDLDVLVIDCPPGTGDEPLSLAQVIPLAQVVMVGTPQEVAMADVRKAISFCGKLHLQVLGLVETMGTVRCPACGADAPLFRRAAASRPPSVPLLAEVPFDPGLQAACDSGTLGAFLVEGGPTARTLEDLAERIGAGPTPANDNPHGNPATKGDTMRYGMPTAEGKLAMHFGHADAFTFVDVADGRITNVLQAMPPAHAPGVLPAWLKENGVDIIIAGGMGSRAQNLFTQNGIQVVVGAPSADAETLVQQHLAGTLRAGDNVCDH
ncbi:MAG: iron-sulfur cluster carrier protein MrpORP [Phycisphaerae bacterium]|nr:iron-sulfur cluster carrier protein MrpORP [Phycisphaerae bacterium]